MGIVGDLIDKAKVGRAAYNDAAVNGARQALAQEGEAILKEAAAKGAANPLGTLAWSKTKGAVGKVGDGIAHVAGAPKRAVMGMGKALLIGGAIAGGVALASSMFRSDKTKTGATEANYDAEMEMQAEDRNRLLRADQMMPQQETMMGIPPTPGDFAARVRPGVQPGMNFDERLQQANHGGEPQLSA